jgi:PAS domain S-box-containing protein
VQCGAVAASVAVVWLARLALEPVMAGRPAYLLFLIPSIVMARFFSTWAALLAFVRGYGVCSYAFAISDPAFALSEGSLRAATILYVVVGVAIIGLMASARRQAERLLQKTAALEEEVASRRAIEADLRLGQEEFRALAGHYPVGVFRADVTGAIVFMNDYWCDMTGLSREEALRDGWVRAIHPDDAAAVVAGWQAAVKAGRSYIAEARLVGDGGATRDVICIGEPVRRGDGVLSHYLGLVFDTTELRQAQENLRHRESQLTSLADHMPAVVFMKDRDGRYTQVNRQWTELFGVGKPLVGRTDYEYFPREVADKLVDADARVWASAAPVTIEESAPLADGIHTFVSIKFPVTDNEGRMIAVGGVSTDVTELKAARESLELKQSLLRRLLEVQEHEKSLLCHEFHDGLIQYAVASKMILESCLQSGPRPLPAGVAKSVAEAARMLRVGIEDGRRVIRGIRTAVLDDIGLTAACEDLVEHMMAPAITVDLDLDSHLDDLPASLQTTAYRVIQEAFSNVRRHSGSQRVVLCGRVVDEELRLTIQDFGCGFDPTAARLRGFGMAGMQERVAIAGGTLVVESVPGAGTTISARLPVRTEEPGEAAAPASPQLVEDVS